MYFDHRYAGMGLSLLRSLREHGATGTAWALCLSEEAVRLVGQFNVEDVRAVSLDAIEAQFPSLATAKADRSTLEYYFTMTPHILRYVFDHAPDAERVAYLDSDLFFFGPVATIWNEVGDAPVALIPHNFHTRARRYARFGTYNVGWVSFHRDPQGLACLDYWAQSCRDWCRDTPEPGRFADQGYLDHFDQIAPDMTIIRHPGCNLAPWNIANHTISFDGARVTVDSDPLIFFHFAGFKQGLGGYWFNSHRTYYTGTSRVVRDHIYRPYLAARHLAQNYVLARSPLLSRERRLPRQRGGGVALRARLVKIAETMFRLLDLATGKALPNPGGK